VNAGAHAITPSRDGTVWHIATALDEQARTRAGREKGEIEAVGGRGDGDKTLDLGPTHQQLHRDPGTERRAGGLSDAPFLVLCSLVWQICHSTP